MKRRAYFYPDGSVVFTSVSPKVKLNPGETDKELLDRICANTLEAAANYEYVDLERSELPPFKTENGECLRCNLRGNKNGFWNDTSVECWHNKKRRISLEISSELEKINPDPIKLFNLQKILSGKKMK